MKLKVLPRPLSYEKLFITKLVSLVVSCFANILDLTCILTVLDMKGSTILTVSQTIFLDNVQLTSISSYTKLLHCPDYLINFTRPTI